MPGATGGSTLSREPRDYRIRIRKLSATPLPRVLVDTRTIVDGDGRDPDEAGALWKLDVRERDLDSNVVAIPPGGAIDAHAGPDLDDSCTCSTDPER